MNEPAAVFGWMQSLSDGTRTRLLRLLERTELTVAELCSVLQCPQSTVSRHLKLLADDGWITSRREGTSRFYRVAAERWQGSQRKLWQLVRDQSSVNGTRDQDDQRLEHVLAERETRSQQFFSSAAGQWDRLRSELFGTQLDAWSLAALLPQTNVMAELGCGTAPLSLLAAPFVHRVIAIDHAPGMLQAARQRLKGYRHARVERAELTALPISDGEVDLATMVLVLPVLSEPQAVLQEARRILAGNGKLLIVDMQAHEREEYRQEMGHVWLGFDREQLSQWLSEADLRMDRWIDLPQDSQAKGPALFAATVCHP